MIVWSFVLTGLAFGLSSGIAPGPLLVLTIRETIRHGTLAGIRVAFAPLITDGLLIVATALLLRSLADQTWLLGLIALLGSGLLLFFARECFWPGTIALDDRDSPSRSLAAGVAANVFNPSPYLFWTAVGTPTLLHAHDQSASTAAAYLIAFFAAIVGAKIAVALVTARFRSFLRSRAYRLIMAFLGLVLVGFAVLFCTRGLVFLGILTAS